MATPRCGCDHTFQLPADPCGLPAQRFEPPSSIAVNLLGPLVGAVGVLWAPVQHAAGFSDRGAAVLLFLAGATRLLRRLRRKRYRWDPVPSGSGRHRRGAW
jgi:hypothetical protein